MFVLGCPTYACRFRRSGTMREMYDALPSVVGFWGGRSWLVCPEKEPSSQALDLLRQLEESQNEHLAHRLAFSFGKKDKSGSSPVISGTEIGWYHEFCTQRSESCRLIGGRKHPPEIHAFPLWVSITRPCNVFVVLQSMRETRGLRFRRASSSHSPSLAAIGCKRHC